MQADPPPRRKEIYRYEAKHALFALAWANHEVVKKKGERGKKRGRKSLFTDLFVAGVECTQIGSGFVCGRLYQVSS